MRNGKIRIGIMGLGQIGRQLYHLALERDDVHIVAVADIGKPEVIEYLLKSDGVDEPSCKLQDNYLINDKFRTRMLQLARPEEVPWDVLDIDCVVDATGRYRRRRDMEGHVRAGAKRVILASLPSEPIDRIVIPGVNEHDASATDKMISAGSATTNAFALLLQSLDQSLGVAGASMTTVHAYSSDQSLQDYAHEDFRRSRSAAENIIPNNNESARWVEMVLPKFSGKLSGYALNVPVQRGSLLDVNFVMQDGSVTADQVNEAMRTAAARYPELIGVTDDPIVSSDVIGSRQSLLFDTGATLKAGKKIVKVLAWYESLGHACRVLDVVRQYGRLSANGGSL
ncbi:MAG TPA: glyceraldehyde 3-phosphate dehydrogenase NAD-binding domain-containing protein [Candidatus Binatia bacterium]|nr:glyceraldehyde 3-phosphate dehydrogenase NAD-binding domain-containing protein [Candidatus Binatia bacterium]